MCKGPEGGKGLGVLEEVESVVNRYWKIKNLGMLKKSMSRISAITLEKCLVVATIAEYAHFTRDGYLCSPKARNKKVAPFATADNWKQSTCPQ